MFSAAVTQTQVGLGAVPWNSVRKTEVREGHAVAQTVQSSLDLCET